MNNDHVTSTADAAAKSSNIKITGNPDTWVLLCKVTGYRADGTAFTNATKALPIPGIGVVLHVVSVEGSTITSHMETIYGSMRIEPDTNGGHKIVSAA